MDTARDRISLLENQLDKKNNVLNEQKKLLKMTKEEYQEKMNALEAKYSAQKAIIFRLEEEIFKLYKNKSAVNSNTHDSDKTGKNRMNTF